MTRSTMHSPSEPRDTERGVAHLTVLAAIVVLSGLGIAFTETTRRAPLDTRVDTARVSALAAAEAGIAWARATLADAPGQTTPRSDALDVGHYRVQVELQPARQDHWTIVSIATGSIPGGVVAKRAVEAEVRIRAGASRSARVLPEVVRWHAR